MGFLVIIGVERIFYSKAQCYCSISLRPTNSNSTETHKVEDIDQHTRNQGTRILSTTCSTCLSSVLTPTNEAPWLVYWVLGLSLNPFLTYYLSESWWNYFLLDTLWTCFTLCVYYTLWHIRVSQILCIFGSS